MTIARSSGGELGRAPGEGETGAQGSGLGERHEPAGDVGQEPGFLQADIDAKASGGSLDEVNVAGLQTKIPDTDQQVATGSKITVGRHSSTSLRNRYSKFPLYPRLLGTLIMFGRINAMWQCFRF